MREFIKEFPNKKCSRGGLDHLLEKNHQIWMCWTWSTMVSA